MKKSAFIKKIAEAVVDVIKKEELPKLIGSMRQPPAVPEQPSFVSDYHGQIAKAQEFLNRNRNADLSQAKCLLRYITPKEYHDEIEKLHEREDPETVYVINGGNNLIAPNALRKKNGRLQAAFPLPYED